MADIVNFTKAKLQMNNFKTAKAFSQDLAKATKEVSSSIDKLAPYVKYKAVARVLAVMKEELAILKNQEKQCQQIVEEKGKTKE